MTNERSIILVTVLMYLLTSCPVIAQDRVLVVAPTSEAAEGLDLRIVGELFRNSENMEGFEKALNDPKVGLNNLDLDENGEVDFIRVSGEAAGNTHVIILQALLAENEIQDVATIEVEKTGSDEYNMQVHGNEVIYGANYYVVPSEADLPTWPIIVWMYGPSYRAYTSGFLFGQYPDWWTRYRPVTINVYHIRTVRFIEKTTFDFAKFTRVKSAVMIRYKPRSSTLVKKPTIKEKESPTKNEE